MSARIESLYEKLQLLKKSIAERQAAGVDVEELLKEEASVSDQLSRARKLLTENASSSIIRG